MTNCNSKRRLINNLNLTVTNIIPDQQNSLANWKIYPCLNLVNLSSSKRNSSHTLFEDKTSIKNFRDMKKKLWILTDQENQHRTEILNRVIETKK